MPDRKNKLTDILVERGDIASDDLQAAIDKAGESETPIEKYLVDEGLVPSTKMLLALADYLDMVPVSLKHFTPDTDLLEIVPQQWRDKLQVVPLMKTGGVLTVAMGDPFNINATEMLESLTGLNVVPVVALESEVSTVLGGAKQETS